MNTSSTVDSAHMKEKNSLEPKVFLHTTVLYVHGHSHSHQHTYYIHPYYILHTRPYTMLHQLPWHKSYMIPSNSWAECSFICTEMKLTHTHIHPNTRKDRHYFNTTSISNVNATSNVTSTSVLFLSVYDWMIEILHALRTHIIVSLTQSQIDLHL